MRFSDGSKVSLATRATARIDRLTRTGAKITLKDGRARVYVKPGEHTDWEVVAGPFAVKVVGTSFAIGWDHAARAFELQMHRGEVLLSGPTLGSRRVSAGGHVRVTLESTKQLVEAPTSPARRAPEPDSESSTQPVSESSTAQRRQAAAVVLRRPMPAPKQQPVVAASVTDMERRVIDADRREESPTSTGEPIGLARGETSSTGDGDTGACFANVATATEMLREAHRARQSRAARAYDLYLCVRQRFGHSERASEAAFGLALVVGADHTQLDRAASWLRLYLEETPNGRLAQAARGRLLEVELQRGARESAQFVARRYLARHSSGPHAALAESTVGPAGLPQ